jgi:hypothetical protein
LLTLVLGLAVAGCVHTGFTRTSGIVLPARSPDCYLDVLQGPPPYPYVVFGEVTTHSTAPTLLAIGDNNVSAIRRLTEQACTVGAHGLMAVSVDSRRVRVGKGYWSSTTWGAMTFVYVDPSGRPLPPTVGPVQTGF